MSRGKANRLHQRCAVTPLRHTATAKAVVYGPHRLTGKPKATKQVTLLLPFYLLLYLWAEALFAHGPKALLGP